MKGLELSERYYHEFGAPMLESRFPELLPEIAAGLLGSGSEVLGFDDGSSRDHDFEPGFCIFLPEEERVSRRSAFLLERAYAALPKEYLGFSRGFLSPVGGNRHGVMRLSDFLADRIGPDAAGRALDPMKSGEDILTTRDWLSLPEQYLLEITSGKLYRDDGGLLTGVRERLAYLPEDIRKKKLAGNLLYAAQSGQYNYERCLLHGEETAAAMTLFYFTEAALRCLFLLAGKYLPYYKWRFRALKAWTPYGDCDAVFRKLLSGPNDASESGEKKELILGILARIVADAGLPKETDPGEAAYLLNDEIEDGEIRNLHILTAVREN